MFGYLDLRDLLANFFIQNNAISIGSLEELKGKRIAVDSLSFIQILHQIKVKKSFSLSRVTLKKL